MGAKTLTKGTLISLCFITISFLISNQSLAKKVKPLPQIIGINSPLRIADSYIITYKESAIQTSYEQLNQKKSSKQVTITDVNVNFSQSIATSSASQLTAIYGNSINGAALINSNQSTIQGLYNDSRIDKIYANLSINQNAYNDSPQPQAPWGLDRIDQVNYPLDAKYHFSNTAQDVHVFVLDSGIDESHPEFNGRLIDEHEFIEIPCSTYICAIRYELRGATDNNGHGTHVAGIIAGKTYGVAKDVILHSYKMLDVDGGSSLALLIDALDTLYDDISSHNLYPAIVNMSFGARFTVGTLNDPNRAVPHY